MTNTAPNPFGRSADTNATATPNQPAWQGELPDAFGETGSGYPGLSFVQSPDGSQIDNAVVLPQPDGKAYASVQVRNFDTKEPEFWNDGKPKMQAVIFLATTGLGDDDHISDTERFKRREARADGVELPTGLVKDFGIRVLYVSGATLPKAFKAAMAKRGLRASQLEVGGRVSIRYEGKRPAPGGTGNVKDFAIKYDRPTDESLATVLKFQNAVGVEAGGKRTDGEDAGDGWS